MSKILCAVLTLAAWTAVGQNLLENPSFEIPKKQNSAVPEAWEGYPGAAARAFRLENKLVLDGKNAARIDGAESPAAAPVWMQKNLGEKLKAFKPGTELELSVMATADGAPAKVRLYLESIKAKKCFITAKDVLPGRWTPVTVRFKTGDMNCIDAYVCLQLQGKGSVVFDCAYLGPAGKNPWNKTEKVMEFVSNGGAEHLDPKGLPVGWHIIKGKNGQASVTMEKVASGRRAFQLQCDDKPQKMLSWRYQLSAKDFASVAPGTEMTLSLKANCWSNPGTRFRFYIEFMKGRSFIGTFMASDQTVYVNWQEKKLNFKMPGSVPTTVNIFVQLMTPGILTFDDVSLRIAGPGKKQTAVSPVSKDYCRIASPAGFSNFYASCPKEFRLECLLPEPSLKVELFEIDGPKITEWKFHNLPAGKKKEIRLPMPEKLPETAYEFRFTSGKMTDFEWFRIGRKKTSGSHFDDDGILVLDGKRFFPVGIITPAPGLDALRVYSASGINTVSVKMSISQRMTEYQLSALQHYKLASVDWNNWGQFSGQDAKVKAGIQRRAALFAKYKGMIGVLSDEPLWNRWKLENMRQNYRLMYKYLPDHVCWLNNAPRLTGGSEDPRQSFETVRAYSRTADVTGVDIYPVPEGRGHNNLPNETISCVGEYTDLCRKMIWDRKPVWMILQAMGWSEEGGLLNSVRPRPTEKQLRFMVWNAITHGAKGIFWYGNGAKDVYSEWWREFARVNLELQELAPLLMAGPVENISGLPENVRGIRGKGFQVVVNESNKKTASVSGRTIEPQGVLFLTDRPMQAATPARFSEHPVVWGSDSGIHQKTVLLDGSWVAHPAYLRGSRKTVYARQKFQLKAFPAKAILHVVVDDKTEVRLNGRQLGSCVSFRVVHRFNAAPFLKPGENELTFEVTNMSGPTGLNFELETPDGKVLSGKDTLFSLTGKGEWKPAHCFGKMPVSPWGKPEFLQEEK